MTKQSDFSKGTRGEFYRPDIDLRMPVYLEPDSAAFLRKIAEAKGTDVQKIVNDLIRRDIDLIKSIDARTGRPMHVAVRLTKVLRHADDGWKMAGK